MEIEKIKCKQNLKKLSRGCVFQVASNERDAVKYSISIPDQCFDTWGIGGDEERKRVVAELAKIKAQKLFAQGIDESKHILDCSGTSSPEQMKESLKKK